MPGNTTTYSKMKRAFHVMRCNALTGKESVHNMSLKYRGSDLRQENTAKQIPQSTYVTYPGLRHQTLAFPALARDGRPRGLGGLGFYSRLHDGCESN
jgi:hypothetical protein